MALKPDPKHQMAMVKPYLESRYGTTVKIGDPYMNMAHKQMAEIAAEVDGAIARLLLDTVIDNLGRAMGGDRDTICEFLTFLGQDKEIQDRFTAWRTHKRLTG